MIGGAAECSGDRANCGRAGRRAVPRARGVPAVRPPAGRRAARRRVRRARVGHGRRARRAAAPDPPDAVAIALHGGEGENGSVQAVLELLGVPFVGTPAPACRRAWDKPTAKAELARAGLRHPGLGRAAAHHVPRARRAGGAGAMVDRLGLPHDAQARPGRLGARRPGRQRAGRTCRRRWSAASPTATPCSPSGSSPAPRSRSRSSRRRRTARAPAGRGGHRRAASTTTRPATRPARRRSTARPGSTPRSLAALEETALAAHRLLGLRDVSRLDAVVDADGRVQILEVNVSPGPDRNLAAADRRRAPRASNWRSSTGRWWSRRYAGTEPPVPCEHTRVVPPR